MAQPIQYATPQRKLARIYSPETQRFVGRGEAFFRWLAAILLIFAQMQVLSLSNGHAVIIFLIGWLAGTIWFFFSVFAGFVFIAHWKELRGNRRVLMTISVLIALVAGFITHWPLRVGFLVSYPFLSSLADRVEAGAPPSTPRLCGIYLITSVQREPNGTPGLYMKFSDSGWVGFIRHPAAGRVDIVQSNNGLTPLTDRWELVDED